MKSTKIELSVVIPVYNEEEIISMVIDNWIEKLNQLKINHEIHLYNDGSRDNSLEKIQESEKIHSNVVVHDKPNAGHGPTILQGYLENIESPWIFQVDSDNEIKPDNFELIWNARNEFDLILASRKGHIQTLPRKFISSIARILVRLLYGKAIWGVNTPYRLMKSSAFRNCFFELPTDTFAPNLILSGYAAYNNLRISEVDIPHHGRKTGKVSLRNWKLLKGAVLSAKQTILYRLKIRNDLK
tara:strand:- start:30 stop:755 length:726 start_codon:yes stop_codon:yes gene_type:complete